MRLTPLDLAIVAAYLAGVTLFGITFRRGQRTVRDYFLGGRTASWWALALSIAATETSTLTIIGTPALAFAGNLTFLQLVLGYLVGRVVIVLLFLPHFFRGEYYTAYQLMEEVWRKSKGGCGIHISAGSCSSGRRAHRCHRARRQSGLWLRAAHFGCPDHGARPRLHV